MLGNHLATTSTTATKELKVNTKACAGWIDICLFAVCTWFKEGIWSSFCSTPLHSRRCKRQTTADRSFILKTCYCQMMIASLSAQSAWTCSVISDLTEWIQMECRQTDRWLFSFIYIDNKYISRYTLDTLWPANSLCMHTYYSVVLMLHTIVLFLYATYHSTVLMLHTIVLFLCYIL